MEDGLPPVDSDEPWHTPDTVRHYPPYYSPDHSDFYGPYSDVDAEGWRDDRLMEYYTDYHRDDDLPWSDYMPTGNEWDEDVRINWPAAHNNQYRSSGSR